jgi:hypothetical protein
MQVERALTLWAIGAITLEMVEAAKGKTLVLGSLNKVDGLEDVISFNETSWGDVTKQYVASILEDLPAEEFDSIMGKAKDFAVSARRAKSSKSDAVIDLTAGERRRFKYIPDDGNCK